MSEMLLFSHANEQIHLFALLVTSLQLGMRASCLQALSHSSHTEIFKVSQRSNCMALAVLGEFLASFSDKQLDSDPRNCWK